MNLDKNSQLTSLNIPHLPMLIEEAFAVLCWQSGAIKNRLNDWTVETLAQEAHMPLEGVLKRLTSIQEMTARIYIDATELRELLVPSNKDVFLLDVQEHAAFQKRSLQGAHSLVTLDLARIFEGLKELQVITFAEGDAHALSTALYLREAGLPRVNVLRGGLDAWEALSLHS